MAAWLFRLQKMTCFRRFLHSWHIRFNGWFFARCQCEQLIIQIVTCLLRIFSALESICFKAWINKSCYSWKLTRLVYRQAFSYCAQQFICNSFPLQSPSLGPMHSNFRHKIYGVGIIKEMVAYVSPDTFSLLEERISISSAVITHY